MSSQDENLNSDNFYLSSIIINENSTLSTTNLYDTKKTINYKLIGNRIVVALNSASCPIFEINNKMAIFAQQDNFTFNFKEYANNIEVVFNEKQLAVSYLGHVTEIPLHNARYFIANESAFIIPKLTRVYLFENLDDIKNNKYIDCYLAHDTTAKFYIKNKYSSDVASNQRHVKEYSKNNSNIKKKSQSCLQKYTDTYSTDDSEYLQTNSQESDYSSSNYSNDSSDTLSNYSNDNSDTLSNYSNDNSDTLSNYSNDNSDTLSEHSTDRSYTDTSEYSEDSRDNDTSSEHSSDRSYTDTSEYFEGNRENDTSSEHSTGRSCTDTSSEYLEDNNENDTSSDHSEDDIDSFCEYLNDDSYTSYNYFNNSSQTSSNCYEDVSKNGHLKTHERTNNFATNSNCYKSDSDDSDSDDSCELFNSFNKDLNQNTEDNIKLPNFTNSLIYDDKDFRSYTTEQSKNVYQSLLNEIKKM